MSRAELIGRADQVCTTSQGRYLEVRDLGREFAADPEYAEALVDIATPRIRGLRQLQAQAPPSLTRPYREYVNAQARVLETDRQALTAAQEGDVAGVEAARARRDSEDALREELAQEIGFEVCSVPKS